MKYIWVPLVLMLFGCSSAVSQPATPEPTPPTPISSDSVQNSPQQRRITMTLTLSHPDDLKVDEGDLIEEGQVISDRTKDRENLVTKKNLLLIQVEKLNRPIPGAASLRQVPPLPPLPAENFLDEVADIERRRLMVESASHAVEQQQRMLDLLQTMPEENLPQATIPHELEIGVIEAKLSPSAISSERLLYKGFKP